MKIISWNVNGIRAVVKKDFSTFITNESPDVLCIQETKAQDDQTLEALESLDQYYIYTTSAERKGYSGTAILTKREPLSVSYGIGVDVHDKEGRVVTAEFKEFFVVCVYVPNSGSELKRLDYRQEWDEAFCDYVKSLEARKPVLVCGDMNVAHRAIDLARPKQNYNKSAGYTQKEIDGMDRYTASGLVDTFRHFCPEQAEQYSWWSYRGGARAKNVGWRIDYILASESLIGKLESASILPNIMGSDHCPVQVIMKK